MAPAFADTTPVPNPLRVFNDYSTPARTYSPGRAVVHYVTSGIEAPPLNDDDRDDVPDYVERVAAAADTAIAYFERRGFARIRPDWGGPDSRPDLYLSRFTPGVFGVALTHDAAVGGAFAAIANNLDPSAEQSLGSLYGTVAHELFHLVQFSYFPASVAPELPDWVLEGSAAAMEARVYPDLDDLVGTIQTREWLAAPHRSLTRESYAARLFWRYLDVRFPRVLPAYLAKLARRRQGRHALTETFARATRAPLRTTFHRFAVDLVRDEAARIGTTQTAVPGSRMLTVARPLGVRCVRIDRPRRGHGLVVNVHPRAGRVLATLTYAIESQTAGEPARFVRLPGARTRGRAVRFTIPARVVRNRRVSPPLLVLTGGITAPVVVDVNVR